MIRWGIIGPGVIAHSFAREVVQSGNGCLMKVYGRNEEKARGFAEQYHITYTTDLESLLHDQAIDAIYIATPHNYHVTFTDKCIMAGKSVLCEKPFSYNYETAKRSILLARERKVFLMEALWTLYLPTISKVKAWINEGKIGRVKLIKANFGFNAEFNGQSRLYSKELAGGALLDAGIYPIAFSNFIAEDVPSSIKSHATMAVTGVDAVDTMAFIYDNGIQSLLSCAISLKIDNEAVIYGENGKIAIPNFWMAKEAYLYTDDSKEHFKDEDPDLGYKYEIREAANCIANGLIESEICSHKRTLETVAVMDELRKQMGLTYPFE